MDASHNGSYNFQDLYSSLSSDQCFHNSPTPVSFISSLCISEIALDVMVKYTLSSLALYASLFASALAHTGTKYAAMSNKRQNQVIFPPADGPCPQNIGLEPRKSDLYPDLMTMTFTDRL